MQHVNIGFVNLLLGEAVVAVPVVMVCAIMVALDKLIGSK